MKSIWSDINSLWDVLVSLRSHKTNITAINKQKVNHCHHLVSYHVIPKIKILRRWQENKNLLGSDFFCDKKRQTKNIWRNIGFITFIFPFSVCLCVCVFISPIHFLTKCPIFSGPFYPLTFIIIYYFFYPLISNQTGGWIEKKSLSKNDLFHILSFLFRVLGLLMIFHLSVEVSGRIMWRDRK